MSAAHAAITGPGRPLDGSARAFLEPRLGRDLGDVRIHADAATAAAAENVSARAYTIGRDIAFGRGRYAPDTDAGRRLLAHEVVHTIQQGGGGPAAAPAAASLDSVGNPLEHEADAVAERVVNAGPSLARPLVAGRSAVSLARSPADPDEQLAEKDYSARFAANPTLARIKSGGKPLAKGDSGLAVTILQQALVDLGLATAVDGAFGAGTENALRAFQASDLLAPTPNGVLDQTTLMALNARFDSRRPYIDKAKFDPANPDAGTRTLSASDRAATRAALVPPRGVAGGASTFQDVVAGKKYGDEMRDALKAVIDALHKELFEDKAPLRADPATNFHDWSALERPAAAAKEVTDKLYGTYATAPPMTHAAGNFIDQWEDEVSRNAALNSGDKTTKTREKVWYLIASNCDDVSTRHSAVPTDTKEKAILTPIVETFIDTPAKVQRLLELDIGWEGAQLEGVVYLQRYKKDTDDKNREQMWELFQTCIHEYIHSLAHPSFQAYARRQDSVRYNTLIEGFDDFFTENVRKTVVINAALRQKVEGSYYDAAKPVPSVSPGVYPSRAQAEQVVAIVGIRNAEAAYFKGDVAKIGTP